MKRMLCILSGCLLVAGVTQAATYTWTGASGVNNRMNTAGNWDTAPTFNNTADLILTTGTGYADPGSTYGNITARSITYTNITGADYIFGINRSTTKPRILTMSADSGNATIAVDSGVSATIAITGTIANGTQNPLILGSDLNIVHNGTGLFNLSARITGANDITKTGSGILRFGSANNDYTGNTIINDGKLTMLSGSQLLFDIDAAGVNNSISGTGQATLIGNFLFDLTGASTTLNDSWQIVDVANLNESFEAAFSVSSSDTNSIVSENNDVWTIAENGAEYAFSEATGTLTVIPEPATLGMVIASAGGILFIRRRFMM